ncbi:glycoside hydrolase family 5 protein [Peterkaempfera sp. SMS 1(5)a]|uniref:glycoside hydrolase family 5 protein n=1 Tax=Peterkaempfera podocarpi TaxID=3232308 RepID=UPI00366CBA0C
MLTAAGAWLDPTGLFALLPGAALRALPVRGAWSFAGLLVFLPTLVAVVVWGAASSMHVAAPGLGRWRVLLRVWGVVVLAASLARLLQVMVELAGTCVSGGLRVLGTSVTTAVWTAGLTGERAAVVGWLPALTAALLVRRRTPRNGRRPWPGAGETTGRDRWQVSAAAVLPIALIGPLVGPFLWEGSPTGSLYGEPLSLRSLPLGPLAYAVELLVAAAVGAVLLGRSVRNYDSERPAQLILGGWLAALGGGAAAGLVQVLTALPRDLSGPPDLFVVPDVLLRVATGLSLGLAAGWAVGPALLLVDRVAEPLGTTVRRTTGATACAVALALVAWWVGPSAPSGTSVRPTLPAAARATADRTLPALTVRAAHGSTPAAIVDVNNRQVTLRGVNVNQLNDYYQAVPGTQTVRPLSDADFAGMAALGFDTVRLNLSWSFLEPQRGHWDQAYLQRIGEAVDMAARHGLYTVLDMHQDGWGKDVAAAPGTACPLGTDPMIGYDGAPRWATVLDGAAHCQFTGRDVSPAVARAFTNFYHDTDGIQSELVSTWGLLARTFGGDPAVAGYDLLNEPGFGEDPPATSAVLLGRYYDRAVGAIRAGERQTPGGYAHLVFFEPSVLWSGLGMDAVPPRGFSGDPYLVFAPHLYSESITMDQGMGLTLTSLERGFDLARQQAREYGAPLWSGEWGWFGSPGTDASKIGRYAAAEDAQLIGGAFWVWKQACGDPQSDHASRTSGNLIGVDCATGKDLPAPAAYTDLLSRAYPRAAPGRLDALSADGSGRLSLRGTAPAGASGAGCRLDVWYPGPAQPRPRTSGITGAQVRRADGGWRLTGCATGAYRVEVPGR